jgi:hypothetical protein
MNPSAPVTSTRLFLKAKLISDCLDALSLFAVWQAINKLAKKPQAASPH